MSDRPHSRFLQWRESRSEHAWGSDPDELDLDRVIRNFSKGNKQKVGVIQAFMHRPELLLLELKGRLAEPLPGAAAFAPAGGDAADILNALLALGYSEKEASAAIKGLAPGLGVAEGIRAALKALAKS